MTVWTLLSACWPRWCPFSLPSPSPPSSGTHIKKHKQKKKKKKILDDSTYIKLRVGWASKDILIDSEDLNIRAIFGQYALLIDYRNKEVIPLTSDGFPSFPLKPHARYVVEVNVHGSNSPKQSRPRFPTPLSPSFSSSLSPSFSPSLPRSGSPSPSSPHPFKSPFQPFPTSSPLFSHTQPSSETPSSQPPPPSHSPSSSHSSSSSYPPSSSHPPSPSHPPSSHPLSSSQPFSSSPLRFSSTSLQEDTQSILSDRSHYHDQDHDNELNQLNGAHIDGDTDSNNGEEQSRQLDPLQECINNINGAILKSQECSHAII